MPEQTRTSISMNAEIHAKAVARAKHNRRSLTKEIEFVLAEAIRMDEECGLVGKDVDVPTKVPSIQQGFDMSTRKEG